MLLECWNDLRFSDAFQISEAWSFLRCMLLAHLTMILPSDLNSCFLLWQANRRVTIVTGFLNSSQMLRTYLLGDEGSLRTNVTTRSTLESERSQSHEREIYRRKGGIMKEKLIVLENKEKVPELVMNLDLADKQWILMMMMMMMMRPLGDVSGDSEELYSFMSQHRKNSVDRQSNRCACVLSASFVSDSLWPHGL